ncbi:GNAT family N-acetyltransferase [Bosea sp. LjRoot9]|uniref:GNAT family N-acetyltransferase n=1 Tax=Bosea sp. LjRoot9 TaxID=3342341 RepID=UPI003ECF60FE
MGEVTDISTKLGGGLSPPSPITSHHDLSQFACGHDALDDWLKARAVKSEGQTSRTYVCAERNLVVGYYCISSASVRLAAAPGKLRRNSPDPVPMIVLGRLAVCKSHERRGIGAGLLKDALLRAIQASKIIGVRGVLVHAVDDNAAAFYKRFDFIEFPAESRTMFMPIETAIRALG